MFVRADAGGFLVEIREGGYDGRGARARFDALGDAVDEARRHLVAAERWRDITATHGILRDLQVDRRRHWEAANDGGDRPPPPLS